MTREIPVPATHPLLKGLTVTIHETKLGWRLQVIPIGNNAQERLRPRWQAAYQVTPKQMPKEPTVRDGCLVLAEELCLALDGWLQPAMFIPI